MPESVLHCEGLPCPEPVLKCKARIEADAPATLRVMVDNEAAKENVTRFLGTKGYDVVATRDNGAWLLDATRRGAAEAPACPECAVMTSEQLAALDTKIAVFITAENMGMGDDMLGGKLMFNFLGTLPELGDELWRIILVNGAVKLAVEGSHVLDKLQALEAAGVTILVCGTCLDFFGILDKKRVGETTNMLDVVTSLQLATKVIRP
ncbi:MAG: sulfurtransferase-like selenium metabolism protein YedF [Desulfovibrionaceae bacterium]